MHEPVHMVIVSIAASFSLFLFILLYVFAFPKKKMHPVFLLILLSLLPLISLLRPGTYESGLLSEHVKYAIAFYNELSKGIIIPRWLPGACSGYGCPVFIIHYQLPFYVSSLFHAIGISFLSGMKILLAISFIASGIAMYICAKDEFGKKSAFIASLFYLFSPYHLEDLHFRVSVGEMFSFIFPPLIFYFSKKIIRTNKTTFILINGSLIGLLLITHQSTALFSLPFIGIYMLFLFKKSAYGIKRVFSLCLSFIIGGLFSAWYWLPAILEASFTRADAGRTSVNFPPFWYSFYSPWSNRFGLLFQGHNGELYTNVGYPHLFIVLLFVLFYFRKQVKKNEGFLYFFLLTSFFIFFLFMQEITKPIWETLPLFRNIGYPFRLLVEIAFITSMMAGFVFRKLKNNFFYIILCFFTVFSTILNWGNRTTLPLVTDAVLKNEPLYQEAPCQTELSTPRWVNLCAPWIGIHPKTHIEILKGEGEIREISRTSTTRIYLIKSLSNTVIKENTYYFPGWKLKIDNKPYTINYKYSSYEGIITFTLPKGIYLAELNFTRTKIREIAESLSLVTVLFTVIFISMRFIKNNFILNKK